MSYEQRMIVLFIIGTNGIVSVEDKLNASNLILTAYDKSQVDRIKGKVDICKSPSISQEARQSLIKEMIEEILQAGESLKEGAD